MTTSPAQDSPAPLDAPNRRQLPKWTWLVALLVCHVGTQISLVTTVVPGISAIYLPIPFAMVMSFWWGPRVVLAVYVNAILSCPLWGLPDWRFWPLYALPEALAVLLGWWLFIKVGKGKAWLPDVRNTVGFVLLAVLPAAILNAFYVAGQLVLLGDLPRGQFWQASWTGGIATLLDGLAIAAPMTLFLTPLLERAHLTRTDGARFVHLHTLICPRSHCTCEILATFAGMLLLSRVLPMDRYWSTYAVFVLWAALRFGVGLAALANLWLEFLIMVLPAMLNGQGHLPSVDVQNLRTVLTTLCLASLLGGRTVSDQLDEIARRKQAEERFRTLSEQASDGILMTDPSGRYVDVNSAGCQMTGYTREELCRMTIADLVHPDEVHRIAPELALLSESGSVPSEWRLRRKDGTVFFIEANSRRLPDGRFLGVIRDITERKHSQELLVESEKLRTVAGLAAGAAHEINSPLAGMVQYAEVILNRLTSDNPASQQSAERQGTTVDAIHRFVEDRGIPGMLKSIQDAGQRASQSVANLLVYSRRDVSTSTVSLCELVKSTLDLAANDFDSPNNPGLAKVNVSCDITADGLCVDCNAGQIQQVLLNLIRNAVHSMAGNPPDRPPTLRLRAFAERDCAVIEVEDNGPGIPRDIQAKVFEPFVTSKPSGQGTGLGLFVCYHIVTVTHGGQIQVTSTPGQKTCFVIHLPLKPSRV